MSACRKTGAGTQCQSWARSCHNHTLSCSCCVRDHQVGGVVGFHFHLERRPARLLKSHHGSVCVSRGTGRSCRSLSDVGDLVLHCMQVVITGPKQPSMAVRGQTRSRPNPKIRRAIPYIAPVSRRIVHSSRADQRTLALWVRFIRSARSASLLRAGSLAPPARRSRHQAQGLPLHWRSVVASALRRAARWPSDEHG